MLFIYYLLTILALTLVGPFLLLKKKARAGLAAKFGLDLRLFGEAGYSKDKPKPGGIWIHSVSVGEFNAVWPLLQKLHEEKPELPLFVSTTTATGQKLAQEKAARIAKIFYFPFDLPPLTSRWLSHIEPSLVAVAETELWPGFVDQCKKRGIKVASINGRISPSSFKPYHALRIFFGQAIRCYDAIGAQSKSEAERYTAIGGDRTPVAITGNLKLDGLTPAPREEIAELRENLGIADDDFVLIAGSTHETEETALLKTFKKLLEVHDTTPATTFTDAKLIIAPRHPERFERAISLVREYGFEPVLYSKKQRFCALPERKTGAPRQVYILDGLGQLAKYYGVATVAFVGGTIAKVGGHSLAEPYAYSAPVICGPHVFKTRDIARALKAENAIRICEDESSLGETLVDLYRNPSTIEDLGNRGNSWIISNQGAVERTMDMLRPLLSASKETVRAAELDSDLLRSGERQT